MNICIIVFAFHLCYCGKDDGDSPCGPVSSKCLNGSFSGVTSFGGWNSGVTSPSTSIHSPSSLDGHNGHSIETIHNGHSIILDIANPDPSYIDMNDHECSGLGHRQLVPKNGYNIKEVREGPRFIWKSKKDEKCTAVNLYCKDVSVISLWIKMGVDINIRRFERIEGGWIEINLVQFNQLISGMEGTTKSPSQGVKTPLQATNSLNGDAIHQRSKNSGVTSFMSRLSLGSCSKDAEYTLDISNPNRSLVTLKMVTNAAGVKSGVYIKVRGRCIIFVVDGDNHIWTARPGDDFRSCYVYEKEGHSSILKIHPGSIPNKCYIKVGDKWIDLSYSDFETRHYKMEKGLPGDIPKDVPVLPVDLEQDSLPSGSSP